MNSNGWVQDRRQRLWLLGVVGGWVAAGLWFAAGMAPGTAPALPAGPAAAPPPQSVDTGVQVVPNYRAVVIGINDYADNTAAGWDRLKTARGDAESVADLLERQYGFAVRRLFDRAATRAGIVSVLDEELSNATANDALIIYYAGHGFYDPKSDEGFWIPSDARKLANRRLPKEEWIWNAMLTKMIGTSSARHVLVFADACYGGSLFRGGALDNVKADLSWYLRALQKPSRFLITSGDIEPVLDSGGQHSIFAQSIINVLQYPDKAVFSASDLGVKIRERISTLTGQMPRMGPLPVATDAGGEFVFIPPSTQFTSADLALAQPPPGDLLRRSGVVSSVAPDAEPVAADIPDAAGGGAAPGGADLRAAVAMYQQGATNSSARLLAGLLQNGADAQLTRSVIAYLGADEREKSNQRLRQLIQTLETRKAATKTEPAGSGVQPRIVACLGPDAPGGDPAAEADALIYRIGLRDALESQGRVIVVERDALESILNEMNLGASNLADPRVRTAIGRLLPASLLVLGNVISPPANARVNLRLVDTQTTQILGSFSAPSGGDPESICQDLAGQVVQKIVQRRPLAVRVDSVAGDQVRAPLGWFHGVQEGMAFVMLAGRPGEAAPPGAGTEVGQARIVQVEEDRCVLQAAWADPAAPHAPESLWLREAP